MRTSKLKSHDTRRGTLDSGDFDVIIRTALALDGKQYVFVTAGTMYFVFGLS